MTAGITWADKLAEAERELAIRRNVYPGFVKRGALSPERAARQISVLEAIAEDYRRAIARKSGDSQQ